MGNVIGDILPMAIGLAISPVPIIAVILMLFTQRLKSTNDSIYNLRVVRTMHRHEYI